MTLAVSIAQGGSNNVTMRNKIINGAMQVYQRNTGTPPTITTGGQFALDRWKLWANSGGGSGASYTVQQSSTAPAGFSTSMLITQTAAASAPSGTVYNCFAQYIEGYNTADLNWGSANAKTVTLSFWVRSSLTGTFGGAITNGDQSRSYAFTYTISNANTWEQKTLTVSGDQSGTWTTDNSLGIAIFWGLGVGSTYSGAAGSWASAAYLSATGATNVVTTNGATFYITGVQLEAGTTATPFEQRLYGQELALCQRYFLSFLGVGSYDRAGIGIANSTTSAPIGFSQPVAMRSGPTITYSGSISLYNGASFFAVTSFTVDYSAPVYSTVVINVASGLTSGYPYQLLSSGNTTARVNLSAEL